MKMLIGGKECDAGDSRAITVLNPADGTPVDTVPAATEDDVRAALVCARRGVPAWSGVPIHRREDVLLTFAALLRERSDEIADLMVREHGRPLVGQRVDLDNNITNVIPAYVSAFKHLKGEINPPGAYSTNVHDLQLVTREPIGVVVAILPFNAPVNVLVRKVIPALMAGNAVIVKPSNDAPLAVLALCRLLLEAGVEPDALSVLTGGDVVGQQLCGSPHINAISFTGSTRVGMDIVARSSNNLTRCHLELGGNDAFLVLDDADLELAAAEAVAGRTPNSGQVCASPKRFLVHEAVAEEFTAKLIAALRICVVGNPDDKSTTIGPMISVEAAARALAQVERTVAQGAWLRLGGTVNGAYMEPTVLSGVRPNMDVARDLEIFAPVFALIQVANDEEAIEIANSSSYGLSGSVFTRDYQRAMSVARRLETGQVVINGHGWYLNPDQPFGGYKHSGLGREGIRATFEAFTQEKTITLKGFV